MKVEYVRCRCGSAIGSVVVYPDVEYVLGLPDFRRCVIASDALQEIDDVSALAGDVFFYRPFFTI